MRPCNSRFWHASIALACACGPSPIAIDAGTDAIVSTEPIAPIPPALPRFTNEKGMCPAGWTTTTVREGAPEYCSPYGEFIEECEPHEVHLPGTPGCRAVGRACAEEFPDPPKGAVRSIYVRPNATGGDGSRAAPFARISDATRIANDGDAILLAPGEYVGAVVLERDIVLRGACAARSTLRMNVAFGDAVSVTRGSARIEDLSISSQAGGLRIEAGAQAAVSGVAFVQTNDCAVAADGSFVLDDVAAHAGGSIGTCGIVVGEGATARVSRAEIRGHREYEVGVASGGMLELEDSAIGGRFEGEEFSNGTLGLVVNAGARAIVRRSFFEANVAIAITTQGGTIEIEDTVIVDTRLGGEEAVAVDAAATEGGELRMRRTVVVGSAATGTFTEGGRIVAEDLLIAFVGGPETGDGFAVQADGAEVELERAFICDAWVSGITVSRGSRLSLIDTTIFATGSGAPGPGEFGLPLALIGSHAEIARVHIELSDVWGFALAEGSSTTGSDLSIRSIYLREDDGYATAAFASESRLELDRVEVDDIQHTGVIAFGTEAELILRNARIHRVTRAGCVNETCTSFVGGLGIGTYDGAHTTIERFVLSDCELAGAQVAYGSLDGVTPLPFPGELDLHEGAVENNQVGVNVQVGGFDFTRILDRVIYRGNDRHIDAALLPVPALPTEPSD